MSIMSSTDKTRMFKDKAFGVICMSATVLAVLALIWLLYSIGKEGIHRLSPDLFTNFTSRIPTKAGLKSALAGTIWVVILTGLISVPIGIAAAIYLQEFTVRKNRISAFIELNIANLAGVPSIVYGLLGLALFVRWLELGRSIIAGALTMSLLILPTVILVSREALKAVPWSYREASFGLGATHWQTIRRQVIPSAWPSILTGIILSLSRAMGETAPLVTIGAVSYIGFVPTSPADKFTVLPLQIFDWTSRPQSGFHEAAAAGIIVLLGTLLVVNATAIILRNKASAKL
jgi:phosphate transport system permease protein